MLSVYFNPAASRWDFLILKPTFDSLHSISVLKVNPPFIKFIPWDHHQIKTKAAGACHSTGAIKNRPGRFWKKEPVLSVEAGWIAAEYRIPSSEFSEMSAAKPSERWIPSSVVPPENVTKLFWDIRVQLNSLNNTMYMI
jgi:hypothetical protein